MNNLGNYFHEQRIRQGLSLGHAAKMIGRQNVSKAANQICLFERDGNITEDLLTALANALGVSVPTVQSLIEQDRQEHLKAFEAWVSEPVPMQLIVKWIPAVYGRVPLPEEITTPEQAEAFACEYAKTNGRKVCLAVSRRLSIWIDKDGVYARTQATPDDPNVPFMRLKGPRTFLMNLGKE